MASTIDPTIWDVAGDIDKAVIKASLAQAAKTDIEALQAAVDQISGDTGSMPEGRLRGRLSAGTGPVESLTPAEARAILAYTLAQLTWNVGSTTADSNPETALRALYEAGGPVIIQTDAEWTADVSTILAPGQIGLASDTREFRFGNGAALWGALPSGIPDGSLTVAKLAASTANRVLVTDGSGVPSFGVIPNGHVVSAMLGDGEVTLQKIADGTPGYIIGFNASTGAPEARAEASGGGVSTVEPIDGTAGGENITEIVIGDIGTVEAKVFILDQNFDINETLPKGTAFTVRNGHASNPITGTIAAGVGGTGTFNTGGSTLAIPPNGVVFFLIDSNPGDEPVIDVRGDFATVSFAGRPVGGNLGAVLTRGAGSDQPTAADSGAWITSDGALTVPAIAGWNCTLEFGGDHDLTFDGDTWDTGASAGDIVSVFVKSATVIRITPLIAAADVITESDFA